MPSQCLLLLIQVLVAVATNCITVCSGTDLSRPVFEGAFPGFQQGKQEGKKGEKKIKRVDSGPVFRSCALFLAVPVCTAEGNCLLCRALAWSRHRAGCRGKLEPGREQQRNREHKERDRG